MAFSTLAWPSSVADVVGVPAPGRSFPTPHRVPYEAAARPLCARWPGRVADVVEASQRLRRSFPTPRRVHLRNCCTSPMAFSTLAWPSTVADVVEALQRLGVAFQRRVAVISKLLHVANGLQHVGLAESVADVVEALQRLGVAFQRRVEFLTKLLHVANGLQHVGLAESVADVVEALQRLGVAFQRRVAVIYETAARRQWPSARWPGRVGSRCR